MGFYLQKIEEIINLISLKPRQVNGTSSNLTKQDE